MRNNTQNFRQWLYPVVTVASLGLAMAACNGSEDAPTDDETSTGGSTTASGGRASSSGGARASGGASSTGGRSAASGGASSTGGRASGGDAGAGNECETIVEIAAGNPDFSILVAAVSKAGLVDALGGDGLTVFAPTNDAFADLLEALGLEGLDDLSPDQLTPILTYHVLGAEVDQEAALAVAAGDGTAETLGGTLRLSVEDSNLVLDADEASATVTAADIQACNGIIHVIDGVVLPSILDIVKTQPAFTSLLSLVGASSDPEGLSEVLDGPAQTAVPSLDPGAFTLFAPSNEAIDGLAAAPPAETITEVLKYHVYAADEAVLAATALTLEDTEIEMLNGDTLTVDGGSGVTLTDGQDAESSVITTDILAVNGVIHRIDGVLLP